MIPRHVQITLILLLVAIFLSGIYILKLRRHTEEGLRRASEQIPVGSQVPGEVANVKLSVAYDDEGVFRARDVAVPLPSEPSARARAVLQLLITRYIERPSPHPLATGSAVSSVFLVDQKLAVINLNHELPEAHRSGIMVEDLTLMSLIDTLAANFPEVQQVKFLVDGKECDTLAGHADLKAVYSTSAVHKLVLQLQ